MEITSLKIVDPRHRNGDPYWDENQTLWEAVAVEGDRTATLLVCVPHPDARVSERAVRTALELAPLDHRLASARAPQPGMAPEIELLIDPGQYED